MWIILERQQKWIGSLFVIATFQSEFVLFSAVKKTAHSQKFHTFKVLVSLCLLRLMHSFMCRIVYVVFRRSVFFLKEYE